MFKTMSIKKEEKIVSLYVFAPVVILSDFLKRIFKQQDSFIFFESFGNKNDTTCTDIFQANKKLNLFFKKTKNINVDLACTILPKDDKMIFPSKEFFNELNIRPNYNLFFCTSLNNYNKKNL